MGRQLIFSTLLLSFFSFCRADEAKEWDGLTFHAAPKPLAKGASTENWPRFLGPHDDATTGETNLLAAFPWLLLGTGDSTFAAWSHAFGWAFLIWGTGLYWWAALGYVWQVRSLTGEAGGTES